jgi:cell division protein FtsL
VRALGVCMLLAGVGLGIVALRVHHVQLTYRADQLRAERARTERLLKALDVEIATLSAPGRLETRARQLGMTSPAHAQVRLAREYVSSGTGAVAARLRGDEALVR